MTYYSKPLSELVKPDWLDEALWKQSIEAVESTDRIVRDAKAHLEAYLASDGKIGYQNEAGQLFLVLTTIGRKSGERKSTPLNFAQEGENFYLVGSVGGWPKDPQWALNLRANPQAWVQVKDKKWEATVEQLSAEERKAVWQRICMIMPMWAVMQQRTDREFPVFRLTPKK